MSSLEASFSCPFFRLFYLFWGLVSLMPQTKTPLVSCTVIPPSRETAKRNTDSESQGKAQENQRKPEGKLRKLRKT